MGCLLECENPSKDVPRKWDRCATNSQAFDGVERSGSPRSPSSKRHPYRHQPDDLHTHHHALYQSSSDEGHTDDDAVQSNDAFPKLVVTNSNSIHSRTSQNSTALSDAYGHTQTGTTSPSLDATSAGSVAATSSAGGHKKEGSITTTFATPIRRRIGRHGHRRDGNETTEMTEMTMNTTTTGTVTIPTDAIIMNVCQPSPTPPAAIEPSQSAPSTEMERSAHDEERHLQFQRYTASHGLEESPSVHTSPHHKPMMVDDPSVTLTMGSINNFEISVSQFVSKNAPKSAPVVLREDGDHQHIMQYRTRSPSTPSRIESSVSSSMAMTSMLPSFRRTHSADPKAVSSRRGRLRSQSKPTVSRTRSVPRVFNAASNGSSASTASRLSVYSFNSQRDAKINVNKTKQRLLAASSREIPQHQFSSSLVEHQDEESNTYQYLAALTHFDINTLRLLHLRFNRIEALNVEEEVLSGFEGDRAVSAEDEMKTNGKLDVNALAKLFGLSKQCLLVKRFFGYMDQHEMGALSFRTFVIALSALSDKAPVSEKLKLSFALYDLNDDGVIDRQELNTLIVDAVSNAHHLMDASVRELVQRDGFMEQLIENTMRCFDLDPDGNIDYDGYCRFIESAPRILAPFTLDIDHLLNYEAERRRMNRISQNTLNTKELRQIIIGQDPKKKYNKTWHRPQFLKSMQKDKVHQVNSIHNAEEIYKDLVHHDEAGKGLLALIGNEEAEETDGSGVESENESEKKQKEERLKQEQITSTIDFLYE